MHHFFTDPSQVRDGKIFIEGSDVNHMKNVLRMRVGEQVQISDQNGKNYLCELKTFEEEQACFRIVETQRSQNELGSRLYLFQGLPKSDKMELIVQKAVELGVYEVIPVATHRAVVKLDEKKAAKKTARWNAIAEGAARQSGRDVIPVVKNVMTLEDALAYAADLDLILMPYEDAQGMAKTRRVISEIRQGQSVGIFIGPEGGFEEAEVQKAQETGAVPITLGKRILRTETAGIAVLSILMYHLE